MGACGGRHGAVNTNRAEDQARPAGRPAPSRQGVQGAPNGTGPEADHPGTPAPRPGRRWSVRVHWGIVFAVVASLILWFAIKAVVELVF